MGGEGFLGGRGQIEKNLKIRIISLKKAKKILVLDKDKKEIQIFRTKGTLN